MPYTLIVTGPYGVSRAETLSNLDGLRARLRGIPWDGSHQVFVCDGALVPIAPDGTIRGPSNRRVSLVDSPSADVDEAIPGQWGRPFRAEPLPARSP